ncbi:hypothetical protein OEV98_15845 [Caldibacillus lycopersici]|uniref:Lipoprotein n=1 Tax=Perspicuibacillus lycopersici TaxID=1325689 RepID=A0AAE3IUU5_9BACI|nr:hypothetical protein [Perspicuibacillus lycopersici]MCU9615008.1 hypothetical protein [Perspicuibacillus lycopersici]
MKKLTKILYLVIALFLFAGCEGNTKEESMANPTLNNSITESINEDEAENEENTLTKESDSDDANSLSAEEASKSETDSSNAVIEDEDPLANYSSQQVEYARVWRQLGPNQNIDELVVTHISAGTPLDPDHDITVNYPEDVIRLTGSRLVDGIVTYSGNGDGTINVYEVPIRWYGGMPPPEDLDKEKVLEDMEDIIHNTELVYVDPGDNEEIIKLIQLLEID